MISGSDIRARHDRCTRDWHRATPELAELSAPSFVDELIDQQHLSNFLLWHEEDRARDPTASDSDVAAVKRSIDRFNQRRNDLTELLDERILQALPAQNPAAPLLSETPGMMIDRLSILALKMFHTREEAGRASATELHRARNRERLVTLETQAGDLSQCLNEALAAVQSGARRFKVYRQLKMYNDPDLNPVLYAATERRR